MDFKKTWLGKLNFVLAAVTFGLLGVLCVYMDLGFDLAGFFKSPFSFDIKNNFGIPSWAALLIGAAVMCLTSQAVFGIYRLRRSAWKKVHFQTGDLCQNLGGFFGFLVFASGIAFRVKTILDTDFFGNFETEGVDLEHVEEVFLAHRGLDLTSFEGFYDSLLAFLYGFTGIKENVYAWLNLALFVAFSLLLYCCVRYLTDAFTAVFPLAFVSLYPTNIQSVTEGGYEILPQIFVLLIFFICVCLCGIYGKTKNAGIINIPVLLILEGGSLVLLPVLLSGKITDLSPSFPVTERIIKLTGAGREGPWLFTGLVVLSFAFILMAAYEKKDLISKIYPITMAYGFLYVLTGCREITIFSFGILLATMAGLGVTLMTVGKMDPVPEKEKEAAPIKPEEVETVDLEAESPEEEKTETKQDIEVKPETEIKTETVTEPVSKPVLEPAGETSAPIDAATGLFIPPLKGPKKHEKKEITFAFEPKDEEMHFDVELAEGDDFDI